jgi:hypothetical protein
MKNPNPQFSQVHLIYLNLNNFKVIEAIGLKLLLRGSLEWYYLRTKFYENLPSYSEVISWVHIERQTGDLISLLSFLESRLKRFCVIISRWRYYNPKRFSVSIVRYLQHSLHLQSKLCSRIMKYLSPSQTKLL